MASGLQADRFLVAYEDSATTVVNPTEDQAERYFEPMADAWHESVLLAGFTYLGGGASSEWDTLEGSPQTLRAYPSVAQAASEYGRTYRLNDSLSGAAPLYIRGVPFCPGNQSRSQSRAQLHIAVFVGRGWTVPGARLIDMDLDYPLTGSQVLYLNPGDYWIHDHRFAYTGGDGYAAVVLPEIDANRPAMGRGAFIVERTTDALGHPTAEGFACLRPNHDQKVYQYNSFHYSYRKMVSYSYATGAWDALTGSSQSATYMWVPLTGSHRPADYLNAYALHYQVDGKWFRMRSFVGLHREEAKFGQPFMLDTGGPEPYMFMPTMNMLPASGVSTSMSTYGMVLAMRWDV